MHGLEGRLARWSARLLGFSNSQLPPFPALLTGRPKERRREGRTGCRTKTANKLIMVKEHKRKETKEEAPV